MQRSARKKEYTPNFSIGVNANLSAFFVMLYNDSKEEGIINIPFTSVAKIVMLSWYKNFVDQELIKPIEVLSVEEKKVLVDECRLDGRIYTNETLTQKCKILYLIQQINNYS